MQEAQNHDWHKCIPVICGLELLSGDFHKTEIGSKNTDYPYHLLMHKDTIITEYGKKWGGKGVRPFNPFTVVYDSERNLHNLL